MAKPKILKPYVKSSIKLNNKWNVLNDLTDLKNVLEGSNLKRKPCKGKKRREQPKPAVDQAANEPTSSQDVAVETDEQKLQVFIGLRSSFRAFNQGKLGALLVDEGIIAPSAVAHVFNVMSLTKTIDFYKVPGLSDVLSKVLNMPKVSALGVGKDEPVLIQMKLSAESNESPIITKPKFQKPEFRHPIGKTKKFSKKKHKP